METRRSEQSGFLGIAVLAVFSVVILLISLIWRSSQTIQVMNDSPRNFPSGEQFGGATTSGNVLAQLRANTVPRTPVGTSSVAFTDIGAGIVSNLLGSFMALNKNGAYTAQAGVAAAEKLGQTVAPDVSYVTYDDAGVHTDNDTSPARARAYRSDLQIALKPLLSNDEAEYTVFGRYVETGDTSELIKLQQYASNYRAAAARAATIVVPSDAAGAHVMLLNALQKFAATLDALSAHASDPFASAALLVTYNSAEADVRASFADLVTYFKQKLL